MGKTLREDCSTCLRVNAFLGCVSMICDDAPVAHPGETDHLWAELAEAEVALLDGDLVYLP